MAQSLMMGERFVPPTTTTTTTGVADVFPTPGLDSFQPLFCRLLTELELLWPRPRISSPAHVKFTRDPENGHTLMRLT